MPENGVKPDSTPEWIRELLHRRQSLCQELDALAGRDDESGRARAGEIAAEYAALAPLPEEYAEIMDKEFAASQKRFEHALAEAAAAREALAAAQEKLACAVESLSALAREKSLAARAKELESLVRTVRSVAGCDPAKEELGRKLADDLSARLKEELAQAAAARTEMEQLVAELEKLDASGDPELYRKQQKKLESRRDSAMGALKTPSANLPEAVRLRELFRKLNGALALHLRAMDLARWESYTLKLDLIRDLESLQDVSGDALREAANRLREIRERWAALGSVPREKFHELGPQYYKLTTDLQHKIDEYFKTVRTLRAAAAEAKTKLCEEAEAVADSTEYRAAAEKLKALQQEWKTIAHAGKDLDRKLFERFRAACDKFFAARAVKLAEGERLKRELCEKAAKLGELSRREALAAARELRAAFQSAPAAGKAEAELRKLFNGCMDRFFQSVREASDQSIKRREEILEELSHISGASDLGTKVQKIRDEWSSIMPPPRELVSGMETRFRDALQTADAAVRRVRKEKMQNAARNFPDAMRAAVRYCVAKAAGENVEMSVDLTPFPRLAEAVRGCPEPGGGLPEDLKRSMARNTGTFRKLLDALERKTAQSVRNPADLAAELAAELAAAIAGNFGGNSAGAQETDTAEELQRKLRNVGVLEPEAAEELLARYEKLLRK